MVGAPMYISRSDTVDSMHLRTECHTSYSNHAPVLEAPCSDSFVPLRLLILLLSLGFFISDFIPKLRDAIPLPNEHFSTPKTARQQARSLPCAFSCLSSSHLFLNTHHVVNPQHTGPKGQCGYSKSRQAAGSQGQQARPLLVGRGRTSCHDVCEGAPAVG